ncbi:MAG: aminoacyl-histidine dipeptidase [Clostridiales bacterium]|nr:aminoacyl-histidine dipeptidase [Clostridiales bacterium]MBQ3322746.1 aminoacyl-histidine dipeptidase [Bacillota bacterium]
MAVLEGLKPEKVFQYFESICQIPHGSGNTKQLSDWLVDFAKARNLEFYQDELNNVIIIKEASAGYEDSEPVILQGHIDMVCNQEDSCTKDMAKEGLDLVVDGDTLYAEGTTLGGDDGIAAAFMLAILDDDSLPHPRVEMVFTTEEETGLYGAEAIDVSPLKGRRFINIDSEDEGILTVGCAGGVTGIGCVPFSREAYEGQSFEIKLFGLRGGHSGTEIILGQENAAKALGRLLFELQDSADARIVTLESGVADNVIPTSASAVIVTPSADKAREVFESCKAIFAHEFKVDTDFNMTLTEADCDIDPMDAASCERVLAYLIGTPNGIEKMTIGIDGLPQTSLNLGVVKTIAACADCCPEADGCVEYTFCIRSSVDSECEMLARRLECQIKPLGGSFRREGPYPGWEYSPVSPLRDLLCEVYKEQCGKDMIIEAIHAGLECGYFSGKIPGLDCVSIGPDVRDVHTPNETLSISSTQRTWELVTEVLARMK